MKGQQKIKVKNRRLQYTFTLERNITILKGDSATGKTTLIDMISAYRQYGSDSGVEIVSDKKCFVVGGDDWKINLQSIRDGIVFIDEGNRFITSKEFAEYVAKSDNYYVIATRNPIFNLPYSFSEIYGIKNTSGNRYQGTKRIYSEFYPINNLQTSIYYKPNLVIVEDSKSGYEFYRHFFSRLNIPCITSGGNSNIYKMLTEYNEKTIWIIADGAAFGPEIERILALKKVLHFDLYLPESFEWIILKSGLIDGVQDILANPSEYIESSLFLSWERYFTDLLQKRTEGTYLAYQKKRLNNVYLQEKEEKAICAILPTIKE